MTAPHQTDMADTETMTLHAIGAAAAARIESLAARHGRATRDAAIEAVRVLAVTMPGRPYHAIPHALRGQDCDAPGFVPLFYAALLARLPARAASIAVPPAMLPELTRQAARILHTPPDGLHSDQHAKDIAICLGLMLPCTAQVVEPRGALPRGLAWRQGAGHAQLRRELLRNRLAAGPYLEIHTHTPMLDGFTEHGWSHCYHLVAAWLRARPELRGMTGGSWFYDPAIARISPRLAYLSDLPLAHGAFRVRIGASAEDHALATATSPSRRALAASGEYLPTKWQLIWPRAALLAWADQHNGPAATSHTAPRKLAHERAHADTRLAAGAA